MAQTTRLLVDPAMGAAANMARDQALLDAAGAGAAPVLRFYRWSPAAISLGYFQPIDDWRRESLSRLDLVRRPTGGGAILHDDELTYSLAVPADWPIVQHRPTRLYKLAHRAIRDTLNALGLDAPADFHPGPEQGNSRRGPFFCFARRHRMDLLIGGDKVVGSAQRRAAGAILQHGSIILRRLPPQPCTGVNDHLAAPVTPAALIDAIAPAMARVLEVELVSSQYSDAELAGAAEHERRYGSDAWTNQR